MGVGGFQIDVCIVRRIRLSSPPFPFCGEFHEFFNLALYLFMRVLRFGRCWLLVAFLRWGSLCLHLLASLIFEEPFIDQLCVFSFPLGN